ncbi:hypothetical protein [Promicromonospora umidemergens]|uniref:Integral membrane protein n=1 Tax=Promicromonospora umidemergens TaxID=629679 RepID=A0ABP8XN39_9MICO|nr:hypothetical protein [Promicromonospora umidemergens]
MPLTHRPRRLRDARGPVVASAATAAALLSHLLGGGAMPGWLGILVPWVLSLTLCTALAARRVSLWRTTTSVVASQVLFHTLFVAGAPGTSAAAGAVAAGHPTGHPTGHGLHGALAPSSAGAAPFSLTGSLIGADATMWCWHGLAAAVTVAALYSSECVLSRLRELAGRTADWLRHRLAAPAGAVPLFPVVRVTAPDWFTGSVPARPEVSESRRRGPPAVLAI